MSSLLAWGHVAHMGLDAVSNASEMQWPIATLYVSHLMIVVARWPDSGMPKHIRALHLSILDHQTLAISSHWKTNL